MKTPDGSPISPQELLAERQQVLARRHGWENSESLRLLKESGAPMHVVYNKVFNYGEERWRLLRLAGYSLRELVDFMHESFWQGGDEIGDPDSHLMNSWTRLFFYCGFDISELKSVGFQGEISAKEEAVLKNKRSYMEWRFS